MFDAATANMPNFTAMTLDEAKRTFGLWADATWDFNKKIESFKRSVNEATSVKRIQQIALGAAASGLIYKARGL